MKKGFKKGYSAFKAREGKLKCRAEVMATLGWKSPNTWRAHVGGKYEHSDAEAQAIERVFAKYGKEGIWD